MIQQQKCVSFFFTSLVHFLLKTYNHFLNETTAQDHKNKLKRILNDLIDVITDVRQTSHKLQPAFFDGKSLVIALQKLINNLNSYQPCKFELKHNNFPEELNHNFKLNCFRIINELCMNVINHAKATNATLALTQQDAHLGITIEDNGKGFNDAQPKEGIGLSNIKYRLQFYAGSLAIESNLTGTTIKVLFPLAQVNKSS